MQPPGAAHARRVEHLDATVGARLGDGDRAQLAGIGRRGDPPGHAVARFAVRQAVEQQPDRPRTRLLVLPHQPHACLTAVTAAVQNVNVSVTTSLYTRIRCTVNP